MTPTERQHIAYLVFEYCQLVDTAQFDALSELLEHCTLLDADNKTIAKGAAIGDFYRKIIRLDPKSGTPGTLHIAHALHLIGQGEEVECQANFFVLQKNQHQSADVIISGQYRSVFDRSDKQLGQFRFRKHQIIPTHIGDLSRHLKME